MADWDDAIDGLYRNEPAEFVSARNALAKRIKAEGDRTRAAEVAKLGRPTVVAWALNQAIRDDAASVDALIEAAERQARAQSDLMAGGEAGELRSATADRRSAADALVRAATGLVGATHVAAVQNTLDAALADLDLRERLRSGTLSETLSAPAGFGFGVEIDGAAATVVRRRPREVDHPPSDTEPSDDAAADTAAVAAREEATRVAKAEVERLEAAASAATDATSAAATALAELEGEVREAEDALAAARLAHARSAEAVTLARRDQERAAALLDDARRTLAELQQHEGP